LSLYFSYFSLSLLFWLLSAAAVTAAAAFATGND
jgi:hypothetical protein